MRLSFEDEANEEIACAREYTPFPRRSWRVAGLPIGFSGRTDNPRCAGDWMTAKALAGMVEEIVKTYHLEYARDASGWWVASVSELRCHTQSRTVDEARRRIREAMGVFIDTARRVKVVSSHCDVNCDISLSHVSCDVAFFALST